MSIQNGFSGLSHDAIGTKRSGSATAFRSPGMNASDEVSTEARMKCLLSTPKKKLPCGTARIVDPKMNICDQNGQRKGVKDRPQICFAGWRILSHDCLFPFRSSIDACRDNSPGKWR